MCIWMVCPVCVVSLFVHFFSMRTNSDCSIDCHKVSDDCTSGIITMGKEKKLRERWNAARALLGIPPLNASDDKMLRAFYSISGKSGYTISDSTRSAYVRIYKSGNNGIRYNMMGRPFQGRTVWTGQWRQSYDNYFKFTFVRHPISRFLSGYNEAYYRQNRATTEQVALSVGVKLFESFVSDLLHFGPAFQNRHAREHVSAMAGVLNYRPLDAFWRLPRINQEWIQLQKRLGVPTFSQQAYNKSLGKHDSSADKNKAYAAAKIALASNETLTKILCHILFPDFHCFRFQLPDECACIS